MTADDDMHDKHGLPPRPPQPGRDEDLREQVRRAILDRDNPYLSEQVSEAQADVAADAVLPLLTAERQDDLDAAYDQGAREWAEMHRQLAEQLREARERADRLARAVGPAVAAWGIAERWGADSNWDGVRRTMTDLRAALSAAETTGEQQ